MYSRASWGFITNRTIKKDTVLVSSLSIKIILIPEVFYISNTALKKKIRLQTSQCRTLLCSTRNEASLISTEKERISLAVLSPLTEDSHL